MAELIWCICYIYNISVLISTKIFHTVRGLTEVLDISFFKTLIEIHLSWRIEFCLLRSIELRNEVQGAAS
jgi:hypothetical protein